MKATFVIAAVGTLITIYLTKYHTPANYSADQWDDVFMNYVSEYRKSYASQDEFTARKEVFKNNYLAIEKHNKDGDQSWKLGVNMFTDMTQQEFQATLGVKIPKRRTVILEDTLPILGEGADINWQEKERVAKVKDQKSCGSCWAFSAIAAIESAYAIKENREPENFSEQQLVDCSWGQGNEGCNGGWMNQAFEYLKTHDICYEKDYAYTARDGTCKPECQTGKRVTGWVDVPQTPEALGSALQGRPISVAVDASNWSSYSKGVFSNCGKNVNHGVLLIGVEDGNWIIKNSWGTRWGENGKMKLKAGNTCAIADYASYPLV